MTLCSLGVFFFFCHSDPFSHLYSKLYFTVSADSWLPLALSRGLWGGFFVTVAVAMVVTCSSNSKGPKGLNCHNSPFHTGTVGSLCDGALELKHHALCICAPFSVFFYGGLEEISQGFVGKK